VSDTSKSVRHLLDEIGPLGLGTAPLGGLYEAVDDETAQGVVRRAWELGIRYFDTAPYYGSGLAERRLGEGLRDRPRAGLLVSTKVGRLLRPDASDWEGAYFDFSYDAALRSLDESLARLELDHVDIALVHDPDDHYDEALTGAFPALARLREEGVVRAIGVGMNQTELLCRFAREADPDCFLVAGRYTVLDRTAADELLPLCEERGITVIAGGVFNSGILAGGDTFNYEAAPPDVVARVRDLRDACARWDVPLPAAAVQFPNRHPAVGSTLVGCRSVDELEEDVRLFELELPAGLWADLA
jgi:D-threo-aldose 1-dehydrogenase